MGEGEAPIGASVTVVSGEEKNIQIKANVSIISGSDISVIKSEITAAIAEYLKQVALTETKVSFGFIGNLIYDHPSVIDYEELYVRKTSAGSWVAHALDMLETELPIHEAADLTLNVL
jgi:uncharacterized phage protein gp47/JayE